MSIYTFRHVKRQENSKSHIIFFEKELEDCCTLTLSSGLPSEISKGTIKTNIKRDRIEKISETILNSYQKIFKSKI